MVHRKPLTSAFVFDGTFGLSKSIHHGVGGGVGRIVGNFGTACSQRRDIAGVRQGTAGNGRATLQVRHVVSGGLSPARDHVALLWWELIGRELVGGELVDWHASLKGLLRVGAGREVLLLMESLSHALKHVGLNLAHVLHVVLLLHALGLTGNGVEGALLLREWREVLARRHPLVGLHGLGGRGCKATGSRDILASAALRTEHAVGWKLSAAGIAVHDAPLPKSA